jgi:hypothetical protein
MIIMPYKNYQERLEHQKLYRKQHIEYIKEQDKLRASEPKRVDYQKQYRKEHRERHNEYCKLWYRNNPDKGRNNHYKSVYGITLDDVNNMLLKQENKCAICGDYLLFEGKKGMEHYPEIDHDHKTGKFRGMLCPICNKGLIAIEHNRHFPEKALSYLGA